MSERKPTSPVAASPGSGLRLRADLALLAEAALQLLDGARAAFVVCDQDLCVIAATRPARKILTGSDDGSVTLLPCDVADAVRSQLRCRLASGDRDSFAASIVRWPGREASMTVRVSPLRGLSDACIAIVFREEHLQEDAARDVASELGLSARERQLVDMLRLGRTNRDIALCLGLTEGTVKIYLHHLFKKLEVTSRTQLVAMVEGLHARRRFPNFG